MMQLPHIYIQLLWLKCGLISSPRIHVLETLYSSGLILKSRRSIKRCNLLGSIQVTEALLTFMGFQSVLLIYIDEKGIRTPWDVQLINMSFSKPSMAFSLSKQLEGMAWNFLPLVTQGDNEGRVPWLCHPFSSEPCPLLCFFLHSDPFLKFLCIYQDDAIFKYLYFYFINFCCTHRGMFSGEVSKTWLKGFLQCLRDVWFLFHRSTVKFVLSIYQGCSKWH